MLPGFGEEYETLSGFRIKVQMSRIMLIMEFFFPPSPPFFLSSLSLLTWIPVYLRRIFNLPDFISCKTQVKRLFQAVWTQHLEACGVCGMCWEGKCFVTLDRVLHTPLVLEMTVSEVKCLFFFFFFSWRTWGPVSSSQPVSLAFISNKHSGL